MQIAIYARVSTGDKGQDTTMQTSDLRAFCASKGWENVTEYIDEGISGSKASRPALDRMLKDCRAGRVDIVLAWRFDRLFRSLKHLVLTIDELSSLDIKFISLKDGVDLTTPTGRFQMQILGAVAEFMRDLTRENVRAGLANARRKGKRLGARPKPLDLDRVRELKARGQYIKERIAFLESRNEPTDDYELGRLKKEAPKYTLRAIASEMGVSREMIRRRG